MGIVDDLYNYGKDLATAVGRLNKAEKDIERLQRQVEDLSIIARGLASELERTRENEQHEREKMQLRLENYLLRKGIAPPPTDNEQT